jgi:hypothetical protein
MKTKLLLLAVLLVVTLTVNAQKSDVKPFKIGAGALIGLPVGDVSSVTSLAYGVDLLGEYSVDSSFAVTFSAGYLDFAKKSGFSGFKMGLIPVLVGGKYNFSDQLYGSAQIGLSFSTESGGGSAFTFAPGIGYKISDNFDLLLKYQSASKNGGSTSFLGVRAGLSF